MYLGKTDKTLNIFFMSKALMIDQLFKMGWESVEMRSICYYLEKNLM